jgi:hypothetical protein
VLDATFFLEIYTTSVGSGGEECQSRRWTRHRALCASATETRSAPAIYGTGFAAGLKLPHTNFDRTERLY